MRNLNSIVFAADLIGTLAGLIVVLATSSGAVAIAPLLFVWLASAAIVTSTIQIYLLRRANLLR